jgi:hypothetical protein
MLYLSTFQETFRAAVGKSWGNLDTRDDLVHLLFPDDTQANADDMAGSQSNCGTSAMGNLRLLGVDGTVTHFRGKASCDPLAEAYAGHYDAIQYLITLGQQHGIWQVPVNGETPAVEPGCILQIGGSAATGGAAHILAITDTSIIDGQGQGFETVEGGQLDPKNPKPSPKNCTLIALRQRSIYERPGDGWWLRTMGSSDHGRKINGFFQAQDMPTR